MTELNFSVAAPEQFPQSDLFFSNLFSQSEDARIRDVTTESASWEILWQYIQTKTISRTGLDVSEVGNTWIGSLADASTLRPFSAAEVRRLGGEGQFTPSAWESAGLENDKRILSIPWLTDTRVIYYWDDVLRAVGLDGTRAFSSCEQLAWSLEKLHIAGVPAWGAPTFPCNNTVHHLASWLWERDADYVDAGAAKSTFCEKEAIVAMRDYFMLYRFMPGPFHSFDALFQAFKTKKVAVVMDGPWLLSGLMRDNGITSRLPELKIALPPGAPFLGGSNLVIWKYIEAAKLDAALALIAQLLDPGVQSIVCDTTGLLPVRQELLVNPPFTTDGNYETLLLAERRGRHLPRITLWGPIENSLLHTFGRVWQKIIDNQSACIEDLLKRSLEPLAKRFDTLLTLF